MNISSEKFEEMVQGAIDGLPEEYVNKINNLAFLVSDYPSREQIKKMKLKSNFILYGLYEGYHQASKINIGPVLPDKITIFRKAIISQCSSEEEVRNQVISTIKHEIAHHFGSDEIGARKAGKKIK